MWSNKYHNPFSNKAISSIWHSTLYMYLINMFSAFMIWDKYSSWKYTVLHFLQITIVGLRKRCTTVYKRDLNPCSELFSPGALRVFFVPFSFFSIRNSNYVLMLIKMKIELHESGIFLGYLTDVNPVIIHWLSSNERVIYWKKCM